MPSTINYHNKRGPDGRFVSSKGGAKRPARKRQRRVKQAVLTNEVAFVADVSGSMGGKMRAVADALNEQLDSFRNAPENQQTFVRIIVFDNEVRTLFPRTPVNSIRRITDRDLAVGGLTALNDAIGLTILDLEQSPLANDPNTSFFLIGFTDGGENRSRTFRNAQMLNRLIGRVNNTGRWSIAFMGPQGAGRTMQRIGIEAGNVEEWDTYSRDGAENMGKRLNVATQNYVSARAAGQSASRALFMDANHLNAGVLDQNLSDQSDEFKVWNVTDQEGRAKGAKSGGMEIGDFVDLRLSRPSQRKGVRGSTYERSEGRAFYELTKSETVQHYKQIAVMTPEGYIYTGSQARQLLGLPDDSYSSVRVRPRHLGQNRLFISSTSSNRILMAGTALLYRKN